MNIGLVVNARGKMCLVHDEPFEATPLWVAYHVDKRQIEIIYDTGATFPIDWEATDEMDAFLISISKILIIRMENKRPVEGYDTSILQLRYGHTRDLVSIPKTDGLTMDDRNGRLVIRLGEIGFEGPPTRIVYDGLAQELRIGWTDGDAHCISIPRHESHAALLRYDHVRLVRTASQTEGAFDLWLPILLSMEGKGVRPKKEIEKTGENADIISAPEILPAPLEWNSSANELVVDSELIDRFILDLKNNDLSIAIEGWADHVQAFNLPYYEGLNLVSISPPSHEIMESYFCLWSPSKAKVIALNWTNDPIYVANETFNLQIDESNAAAYARFYFHFVRGQLGRFIIAGDVSQVPWLTNATEEERATVASHLSPLRIIVREGSHDFIILIGTVIFKNALFSTKVRVATRDTDFLDPELNAPEHFTIGQMKLFDEEVLIEDLNVSVDGCPKSRW